MRFSQQVDWSSLPLGKRSDSALARELGCDRSVVRTARLKAGIATWGNRKKTPLTNGERYQRDQEARRTRNRAAYHALSVEQKKARFAQSNAWYKSHPGKKSAQLRKRKYGIDEGAFNDLLHKQGNICAVCKKPGRVVFKHVGDSDAFVVDHDHDTGIVRGILHSRCNRAIGLLNDDLTMLENAVSYLRTSGGKSAV